MIFLDSNVLIDVLTPDQTWRDWSYAKITELTEAGQELIVNPIVVAELASNFPDLPALRHALDRLDVQVAPLLDEIAFAAGQAFRRYRRANRNRNAILADFLVGAHAIMLGGPLLTRDSAIYRVYFPDLPLITPETHPHG